MATKSRLSTYDDDEVFHDATNKSPDVTKPVLKNLRNNKHTLKTNPKPQCPAFAAGGIRRSPTGEVQQGKMTDTSDTDTV